MPNEDRLALIADVAGNYLRQNAVGVAQIANVVANVSKALDAAARERGVRIRLRRRAPPRSSSLRFR